MAAKPKMLQAWQAYHALTYESQWKPQVDKEWAKYKLEWESQNPSEKPPEEPVYNHGRIYERQIPK